MSSEPRVIFQKCDNQECPNFGGVFVNCDCWQRPSAKPSASITAVTVVMDAGEIAAIGREFKDDWDEFMDFVDPDGLDFLLPIPVYAV